MSTSDKSSQSSTLSLSRHGSPAPRQRVVSSESKILLENYMTHDVVAYHGAISERIDDLYAEIRALERAHNAATMTCRLPVEVLSEIFLYVRAPGSGKLKRKEDKLEQSKEQNRVDHSSNGRFLDLEAEVSEDESESTEHDDIEDHNEYPYYKFRYVGPTWLLLTQICSHWRTVAIDCPSLWANIPIDSMPRLLENTLSRSKALPLEIRSSATFVYEPYAYRALQAALEHTHRLRVVDLEDFSGGDRTPDNVFSPWTLSPPGPMLEECRLSYGAMELMKEVSVIVNAPLLKKLSLCCDIGSSFHKFTFGSQMTHLSLRNRIYGSRPSRYDFISSLQQMPCLEQLQLTGSFPLIPPDHSTHLRPTLAFPSLKSLVIQDEEDILIGFFRVTRVPNVNSMSIILAPTDPIANSDAVFRNLRSSVANDFITPFDNVQHLSFTRELPTTEAPKQASDFRNMFSGFKFWVGETPDTTSPPVLTLGIVNRSLHGQLIDTTLDDPICLLDSFHKFFDLSSVQSVHVLGSHRAYNDGHGSPLDNWGVLPRLPKLRRLTVNGAYSRDINGGFIRTLDSASAENAHEHSTPNWPVLSSIIIQNTCFDNPRPNHKVGVVARLTEVLRRWPKRSAMQIEIMNCQGMLVKDFQLMRKNLKWINFKWDGRK